MRFEAGPRCKVWWMECVSSVNRQGWACFAQQREVGIRKRKWAQVPAQSQLKLIWRVNSRERGRRGSWGLRKMMDYIHLAERKCGFPAVEGGKKGGGASATADPVLFTSSPYSPSPFFLTLSLLIWSRHDGQTGPPVHVWQLISLAGGKQLDTAA